MEGTSASGPDVTKFWDVTECFPPHLSLMHLALCKTKLFKVPTKVHKTISAVFLHTMLLPLLMAQITLIIRLPLLFLLLSHIRETDSGPQNLSVTESWADTVVRRSIEHSLYSCCTNTQCVFCLSLQLFKNNSKNKKALQQDANRPPASRTCFMFTSLYRVEWGVLVQ